MIHEDDLFSDSADLERDLNLLESLRWARKEFLERICEASVSRAEEVLTILRVEATYQIAEFLYLLHARNIKSEEQIGMLAELHNGYIVELTKDPNKIVRLGLGRARLLESMFTADTLPRLLRDWSENPGVIDQSNLARFLAVLMSPETCRKVILACAEAGFVARKKSAHDTMLVQSNGILEGIFGSCLRNLRRQTEGHVSL